MIEADRGGSKGPRSRRFKYRLQEFADETGLAVTVCHYPTGASKWNPIEHRLFSQISATWSGRVRSTAAIVVGRIRRTTTATGLRVTARVMKRVYRTGVRVGERVSLIAISLPQDVSAMELHDLPTEGWKEHGVVDGRILTVQNGEIGRGDRRVQVVSDVRGGGLIWWRGRCSMAVVLDSHRQAGRGRQLTHHACTCLGVWWSSMLAGPSWSSI